MKNRKKLVLSAASALAILLSSSSASALTDEEYNQRVGNAQQKIVAADQILENIRTYENLRNRYLYVNDSLFAQSKQVFKLSSEWIKRWSDFLRAFDRTDVSNYEKFLTNTQTFFEQQSYEIDRLDDAMEQVRRLGVDSGAEFTANFTLNSQLSADQKSRFTRLQAAYNQLQQTIGSVSQLTGDKLGELRLIQDTVYKGITLKVKQRLLAQGSIPLESGLARYKEMQEAAKIVAPLKFQLEKSAHAMAEYALNFSLQRAKELQATASQHCVKSRQTISASTLSKTSKDTNLSAINKLCDAINTNWTSLNDSGLSARDIAVEFNALMTVQYQDRCKTLDPALDCSVYKALSGVGPDFFKSASDAELLDLEQRWSSIELFKR